MENKKIFAERMLDLLVEMSEYCLNKKKNDTSNVKCDGCQNERRYGYANTGCLLVDLIDNNDFIDLINDTCEYHNIETKNKINKILSIYDTNCDE